jgi:hypothetical protein
MYIVKTFSFDGSLGTCCKIIDVKIGKPSFEKVYTEILVK